MSIFADLATLREKTSVAFYECQITAILTKNNSCSLDETKRTKFDRIGKFIRNEFEQL